MRTAYLDCFNGISGDMCLGALLDAGASENALMTGLEKLSLKGYELNIKKVKRAGFPATSVTVAISGDQAPARRFSDVTGLLSRSRLPKKIKEKGIEIFTSLFRAEAKVHGGRYDRVHLHELGAVDAIVDIIGTLLLLDSLKIKRLVASEVNLGGGTVRTAHGELPVPAPATAELLKGVPVYGSDTGFELTTPTGAVLVSSLAVDFGSMPSMKVSSVGLGAGRKDTKGRPNVLRVFIGEGSSEEASVVVIETNLDDMNPQVYPHVMEMLLKSGALDVWLTQVIMKKGRPGMKLSVLCDEQKRSELTDILLKETTTLGVRYWNASRTMLERDIRTIETEYGPVRIKMAGKGKILKSAPEYEDVRRVADKYGIPLVELLKVLGSGR